MAQVTLKGNPVQTIGNLPAVGEAAPGFTLVDKDLKEVSLQDYAGQKVVLNIFPSIDTPTCSKSVRQFIERVQMSIRRLVDTVDILQAAAALDPDAGQDDPAPADHGPEGQGQGIAETEYTT